MSRKHRKGPCPPQKSIRRKVYRKRRVNTEVHEAFWSCGKINRTGALTDKEFNRQVAGEIGYLFKKSAHHARGAIRALSELVDLLF